MQKTKLSIAIQLAILGLKPETYSVPRSESECHYVHVECPGHADYLKNMVHVPPLQQALKHI